MTAPKRDVSYRHLSGQLTGKPVLSAEDDAHLQLRLALYGSTTTPRARTALTDRLAALDAFVEREGHARVPAHHVEGGLGLGNFVHKWRQAYKSGRLPSDVVLRLESSPGWVWSAVAVSRANRAELPPQQRAALDAFVEREGHARVPREHKEPEGYCLGVVVSGLRSDYKNGLMSSELAAKLEALPGWTWSTWGSAHEKNLAALDSFREREGHLRVKRGHVENGVHLFNTVTNWRAKFVRGALAAELVDALESRPGWVWSVRSVS